MEPGIGLYSPDSPIFRPLLPPEHETEEQMHMASDIFLSYCREDRPLAEQFVRTAAARGVNVWFDEEIGGGQNWREKIVGALGTAKALVILFSEHSNGSRQVIKELAIADSMRKLVIPVLISNCEPQGAYLYEMASRNWINIYPNPETRLAPLVDTLIGQLELRAGTPTQRPTSVGTAPATPPTIPLPAPAPPAHDVDESWFPLGRFDLYILVPILVGGFLLGIFNTGEDKKMGLALSWIASLIYMFVISVRNARLNRSVFSGKSFTSYFAVLVIGLSPTLVIEGSARENITSLMGMIPIVLLVATVANVTQVILRKLSQRNIFRSKVDKALAR
jgi:TIR domain